MVASEQLAMATLVQSSIRGSSIHLDDDIAGGCGVSYHALSNLSMSCDKQLFLSRFPPDHKSLQQTLYIAFELLHMLKAWHVHPDDTKSERATAHSVETAHHIISTSNALIVDPPSLSSITVLFRSESPEDCAYLCRRKKGWKLHCEYDSSSFTSHRICRR
jgi:hypothetical protein